MSGNRSKTRLNSTSKDRRNVDSDDDAWGISSDEEVATTSTSASISNGNRKHAPPARPHPAQFSSSGSNGGGSGINIVNSDKSMNQRSASNHSRASWTMVDSNPSTSPNSLSLNNKNSTINLEEQTLAGSPPTNLGSSAAAAIYQAAKSGASVPKNARSKGCDEEQQESEIENDGKGRHGKGKETESEVLKSAVRGDWEGVVAGESW